MLKIKEIREEKGFTQGQLAEKLGVVGHNVGDWERGKCEPSINMLIKIANALEISVDYLIGNADDFGNVNIITNGAALSKDEKTLLECFEKLNIFERESILIQVRALASNSKSETIKK